VNSSAARTAAAVARRSPYQGLVPYTEADADWFFGREEWCEVVTDNLRAAETAKTDEAESALRTALAAARLRAVLPEHPDAVLNAAFSPNGAPRVQGAVATLPLYAPDGNAFAGVARSGISSVARR
jgi:Novel STAND NTPase 1